MRIAKAAFYPLMSQPVEQPSEVIQLSSTKAYSRHSSTAFQKGIALTDSTRPLFHSEIGLCINMTAVTDMYNNMSIAVFAKERKLHPFIILLVLVLMIMSLFQQLKLKKERQVIRVCVRE